VRQNRKLQKAKKSKKSFILNATPLIFLSKIGFSSILNEFKEEKFTTPLVKEEVVTKGKEIGVPDAVVIEAMIKSGILKVRTPTQNDFINVLRQVPELHEAEIQVLALTKEINGIAILDDTVARQAAIVFEIEVHGTAYLLLRQYFMGFLSKKQTITALNKMISVGWWISAGEYVKILEELDDDEYIHKNL